MYLPLRISLLEVTTEVDLKSLTNV